MEETLRITIQQEGSAMESLPQTSQVSFLFFPILSHFSKYLILYHSFSELGFDICFIDSFTAADLLGFTSYPPAYLNLNTKGNNLLNGANFASAASGYYKHTAKLYVNTLRSF